MITTQSAKECKSATEMLERAARVAQFYGFIPFENAPKGEIGVVSGRTTKLDTKDISFSRAQERMLVSAVKVCAVQGLGDKRMPVLLYRLMPGEKGTATALELHAIGIPDAIAEGLLIAVSDAIAGDVGIAKRVVHINSIGSSESSARYARDLGVFLRKYSEDFPTHLKQRLPSDPIGVLLNLAEKGHPQLNRAPVSMDYLNEEERRHFWDVLEYLELSGNFYELNPLVLGSRDCWAHTLFEVSSVDEETGIRTPFARGGRYDSLAGRCVGAGASAVTVSIVLDTKVPAKLKRYNSSPSVYFAHLGKEARRRTLPALELLRRAEIPVHQSLAYEQLAPQMADAKRLNVPWLLVMGHKEAMDGTMIVRDVRTNFQESVLLPELPGYLRRRRVSVS